MSAQRNRANVQDGVMDRYGNYNPGDAMDTPVDDLIRIFDVESSVNGIAMDPVLFKGLEQYELTANYVPGVGVELAWNWPELTEYRGPLAHITTLIIQRSSTSHKSPICQAGDGLLWGPGPGGPIIGVGAFQFVSGPAPAADPNWVTVFSSDAQFVNSGLPAIMNGQLPTEYTDASILTADGHVFVYRLILIFLRSGVYRELDFNTATIIKPYSLNVTQGNPNTISWGQDRPTAAELFALPGFGTLRIVKYGNSDFWSELNWVPPENSPAPASYKLYKTVNGSTFELVGTNVVSPFRDGARPGVGITFRYKVEAILTDASQPMSNIVSIDHDGNIGT